MRNVRSSSMPVAALIVAFLGWSERSSGRDLPALSKDNGPYMVLARDFRGPVAEDFAKALARELRKDHDLPSFVFEYSTKNGLPGYIVLVGDCKTPRDAYLLCKRVREIQPKTPMPSDSPRKGLTRALQTTNPLATIK